MVEKANARLLQEQKRKDLERLEAELDAAAPAVSLPVTTPLKDKFAFFSKKVTATNVSPPRTSGSSGRVQLARTRSNEPPRGIEQGGGGIVPQTDAPISASNAGERVSGFEALFSLLTYSSEFLSAASSPRSTFQLLPKRRPWISYTHLPIS